LLETAENPLKRVQTNEMSINQPVSTGFRAFVAAGFERAAAQKHQNELPDKLSHFVQFPPDAKASGYGKTGNGLKQVE